jgi:hypothetical protein
MRDTGIAERLRGFGLSVVEVAGWQERGSTSFDPRGSVHHHTAGAAAGNVPSLKVCVDGRSDLPGPLCNVLIARDNTCFVIASGRANHAGRGSWKGLSGNSSVWGVEHENVGTGAEPWRPDQVDTAARVHAALISGRATAAMVCQHREWAPGRKVDAFHVDGDGFRAQVDSALQGRAPTPEAGNQEDEPMLLVKGTGDDVFATDLLTKTLVPPGKALETYKFILTAQGRDAEVNQVPDEFIAALPTNS